MPMIPAGNQFVQIGEGFLAPGINGAELDPPTLEGRNPACRQNFQRKIQRQRARMK
jgi:hypothetical protein